MNERIKKLKAEALVPILKDGYTSWVFNEEKFAELIVRECAKFLEEISGYDNANNSWHPEPEDLLEYFGVEQ